MKIDIRYVANNLPTFPPLDGGQCPAGKRGAIVKGTIEASITPNGDIQGGGDVSDTPHLAPCRVPVIKVAVDDIDLDIIQASHILRARLTVHIDGEGVHQPGDCKVGTVERSRPPTTTRRSQPTRSAVTRSRSGRGRPRASLIPM